MAGSKLPPGPCFEVTYMNYIERDSVCGELLDWEKAAAVLSYRGGLYYFCSLRCSRMFRQAPASFVKQLSGLQTAENSC